MESIFERTWRNIKESKVKIIPKSIKVIDFMIWLSETQNVLFHGSNNQNITELEPRKANCTSKEFGNLKGVYAVSDPILPIFYAIKDTQKFRGMARSGILTTESGDKKYNFEISPELLEINPWSDGAIYILPKEKFRQGKDDYGNKIDEWICEEKIKPIGKILITPEDFPYLDQITPIKTLGTKT